MPTANDLIESASLKLGAKQTGEALTADEASDSLAILNSMLDFWAIHKTLVFQIKQETFTWTGGSASMTIGSGGNFDTTRPIRIEDGTYFTDANSIDTPVMIMRNRASYDSLPSKSDQTTFPEKIYYEPSDPLGRIYAYPVPSGNITFKLNSWQVLQSFAGLTTALALPPGYQYAIEYNLALELEPVFNVPASDFVIRKAGSSLAAIKRINNIPLTAATETAGILYGRGRPDIEAGTG